MSWRHSQIVAVRHVRMLLYLWPQVKPPGAMSRIPDSYQRRLFHHQQKQIVEQDAALKSSNSKAQPRNKGTKITANGNGTLTQTTGLFYLHGDVHVSGFHTKKNDEPLKNDAGNSQFDNEQTKRKHPYIHYGTHLDPVIFNQLSQECKPQEQGSTEQEIFHPKFTPRNFYREAVEYRATAIVFPQVKNKKAVANEYQFQTENLLNQFLLSHGLEDQGVMQLLESLDGCDDEFLLQLPDDMRFIKLTEYLGQHCPHLETDTFVKVLTLFARAQIRTSNPVLRIFEIECEKQCVQWNVETSLLVCDAWRLIGLPIRQLNSKLFDQIGHQRHQLTRYQVVQLIYLIGENRHAKTNLLNSLQDFVLENITTLSPVELGAVCQGFFKSKTNLKSTFVRALARRLQTEPLDQVHSYDLVGLLKVFRQAYLGNSNLFKHIGNEVSGRLRTFPVSSVMHIILTYATLHIYHENLLEAAAREVILRAQECRCKDLSKILWSFATLNHLPQDSERFFGALTTSMGGLLKEYHHFPMYLISGLLSLAYLNMYPVKLLNIVFSPRFLLKIDEFTSRSSIDPRRDLFLLHSSTKIDSPEYDGNCLTKDFLLSRPFPPGTFGSLHEELTSHSILTDVLLTLTSLLGGEQFIKMGFILPHMKLSDIEVHLDSQNHPMPFEVADKHQIPASLSASKLMSDASDTKNEKHIPLDLSLIANLSGTTSSSEKCRNTPAGRRMASMKPTGKETSDIENDNREDTRRTPVTLASSSHGSDDWSRFELPEPITDELGTRWVILVWSRNHFHFNGKKLLGLHAMKRRQLRKLGYKTIDIPFFEWNKLTRHREKEHYIRQKLFQRNNSDI